MEEIVIAVDPGREKCGVALVRKDKRVLHQAVIETSNMAGKVAQLASVHNVSTIVIGNRTSSREARQALAQISVAGRPLRVIPVDEHRTTDAARRRYWRENPPRGLKRLIPTTMQVPPVPVDDYAAVILAERYFGCSGNK